MTRKQISMAALALCVCAVQSVKAQDPVPENTPASQLPPIKPLGAVFAKSKELLGAVSAVRALPGGKVLVNDINGRKVVLFAVPGAFTPTCSAKHLPGFVQNAADFKAKGVDTVACISVNDAFVMGAWGEAQNVGDGIVMLADGNGEFARAVGLEFDGSAFGLATRSQRYAMVIEDGVVTALEVEPGPGLTVSAADAVLALL